jgi:hypothetical protein
MSVGQVSLVKMSFGRMSMSCIYSILPLSNEKNDLYRVTGALNYVRGAFIQTPLYQKSTKCYKSFTLVVYGCSQGTLTERESSVWLASSLR